METLARKRELLQNISTITAACGLAISGVASTATAQDEREDKPAREWSWDEGVHEEEWYDPTDWFDDDFDGIRHGDIDYEIEPYGETEWSWDNDADYDDDSYALYGNEVYDRAWWSEATSELYTDGYLDGYYDGYRDDEFGYDYTVVYDEWSSKWSQGYADGYYDGFYDNSNDYNLDWTYYLYVDPVTAQNEQNQRERNNDKMRDRGDRAAMAGTEDMNRREASRDAQQRATNRVRGTVQSVDMAKNSNLPEAMRGHKVARVKFEDGRTIFLDLGKKAKRNIIEDGDRLTAFGKRMKMKDRMFLDVSRLTVNDKVMWNAQNNNKPERVSAR